MVKGGDLMNVDLDFVRKAREENNISLMEMAKAFGFKNASTYLRYENGDYKFKAEMLPIMSKKFKCGIEDFFCKDDC